MINETIINNKQELDKLVNNIMRLTDTKTLDDIQELAYTLKKFALERILEAEMEEHLGYDKNKKRPEGSDNYRNGTYPKIVKSSSGEISLDIPRDRKGEFTRANAYFI